jgi:hypothetical protein
VKEFYTAAKDTIGETTEDDLIVFMHDEQEVTFFQPSAGQLAIMLNIVSGARLNPRNAGAFIQLFFEMMDDETQSYFQNRLMDRKDTFDLEGEGGMFKIFEYLTEEWSARPTKQPSDYQPPRRATGSKSTGTTRAVGSTSSRSRSRGSSQ